MKILVVDDEHAIRFALAELLGEAGHDVRTAEHAPAALGALDGDGADLVISDLNMPAMNGLQLLEEVRARHAGSLFVLLTAHGDERLAVEALRLGAWDYIPKPFDNAEIVALAERAREVLALRTENARLRAELHGEFKGMIGSAPAMREVFRTIRRAAPADVTVLVTGESGTGKEIVARALHDASRRAARPFVAVNCSAIQAELVESELFGHRKGAFTGADRDREGVFAAADRGTLFLDEIGDLALPAQAKLLRALEERTITPVGATREQPVDVRVLAATNRPLEALVASGAFREDLLYRLRVIALQLPPLRERREDIMPIATHFVAHFAERHALPGRPFGESARRALVAYDWPGNVRELRNVIERAVVSPTATRSSAKTCPPRSAKAPHRSALSMPHSPSCPSPKPASARSRPSTAPSSPLHSNATAATYPPPRGRSECTGRACRRCFGRAERRLGRRGMSVGCAAAG
jgi:two-component system, NtrC family, response regulator HydG